MKTSHSKIIFFDDVCVMCNSSVDFILKRDQKKVFSFASLDSETAKKFLKNSALSCSLESDLDSIILIEGEKVYTYSSAALRIAAELKWPWSLLKYLLIIPSFIRDFIYKLIAKNRYRWFGKLDQCRFPTSSERERFLS